jgi:hypothetical protein
MMLAAWRHEFSDQHGGSRGEPRPPAASCRPGQPCQAGPSRLPGAPASPWIAGPAVPIRAARLPCSFPLFGVPLNSSVVSKPPQRTRALLPDHGQTAYLVTSRSSPHACSQRRHACAQTRQWACLGACGSLSAPQLAQIAVHAPRRGLITRLAQPAGRLSTAAVAAQISAQPRRRRKRVTISARCGSLMSASVSVRQACARSAAASMTPDSTPASAASLKCLSSCPAPAVPSSCSPLGDR